MPKKAFDYSIFVVVIIVIALLAFLAASLVGFFGSSMPFFSPDPDAGAQWFVFSDFWWIILLALFLFLVWKYDPIIFLKDYERAVIFRFGKVNRVGGPGWALMIPGIESFNGVDLRTKTLDIDKQDVITKDSIELRIDSIIYLKIKSDRQSVINSIIEIVNYEKASILFVIASIRDRVGSMELSEVISNIDKLNEELKMDLEKIAARWGISVQAVEIKDVQIPRKILDAMHAQKAAVQEKLARIERAEAQEREIEAVERAAAKLSEKTLSYYYVKALEEMSKGKSTKLVFPLEFSRLAQSLGSDAKNPQVEAMLGQYKDILQAYVDEAVKKAKEKEKKEEFPLSEEEPVLIEED